ncbi:hypothetical protein BGW42_001789 [Actinomortierella wolfii]|nr:hypothetical protein BGW42_001789 [Actinomortierella wolfii]
MENTPFLANYQDYRAQSPVREQFAMLQQQQQHPRHGSAGSQHAVSQRTKAGYGSSLGDGQENTYEPVPRSSLQYPIGSQEYPPSSPVLSEHSSVNYRASHQHPHHHQQQNQQPHYYGQGGSVSSGIVEERSDYSRIDPYRSAMSQQHHASSSSASSPFLGPQSIMMYHNNNNSTISGHSQQGFYEDAPSSYDSRLSMLGQHPARPHHMPQQQYLQQQPGFPLVLLDSHRSEGEYEDRPTSPNGRHPRAMMSGHISQPSKSDSAGSEDRHTRQSGMEDDDDLSDGARRARAAILAAHQGAAAGPLTRSGINSTGQRSDAANTSGTATQDLIQGENKSSSTSGGSDAGAVMGAAADDATAGVASKESKRKKKKTGALGPRYDIDSEDELEEGQEKGALRRREPRCCCLSRRACVYTTFLSLILLAVVLFFVIPRMPVVAFDSVRSDEAPVVTMHRIEEPFTMRLRMDNRASWVPLKLNRLDLRIFYKLDQSKIGSNEGLTKELTIAARRVQFIDFPMELGYTSLKIDTNTDGVFQDLVRACTPIPPTADADPLGINIQVQGKLSVWGLAWAWKPQFTLEVSNMPCPINARPPPVEPEEPAISATTTSATASPTASPTASTSGAGSSTTSSTRPTATTTSSAGPAPTTSF